jgi:hypothetical protein
MVHSGKSVEGSRRSIEEEVKLRSRLSRPGGLGNEIEGIVGPGDEPAVDREGPAFLPKLTAPLVSLLSRGTNVLEAGEHLSIVARAELRSSRVEIAFCATQRLASAGGDLRGGLFEKVRLAKEKIERLLPAGMSTRRSLFDLALQVLAKGHESLASLGAWRREEGRALEPL